MNTKKCSGCKRDLSLPLFSKDKHQKSGYRCKCKECSSKEFLKFKQSNGYETRLAKVVAQRAEEKYNNPKKLWAHRVYHSAKQRASKLDIAFSLTKKWVEDNAPTHCPLLNILLVYNATKSVQNTASIDRKDSTGGYTPDNCKIISFKANRIKNNATVAEIILLATNMKHY